MTHPEAHRRDGAPAPIRILIVDDDAEYGASLSAYLAANGLLARAITQASQMPRALQDLSPDLLILDQRLGETTGTEVLRGLRSSSDIPCIVVSGYSEPTDRIVNLEIGADDEVEKSVSPREILARIRALMRRQARPAPVPASEERQGWTFVIERRELLRPDGERCHLTTAEYETLRILYEAAGRPVSRELLSTQVFGRDLAPEDRAVDTVIRKIRRKLGEGDPPEIIKTVRPLGYVFSGFP